MKLKHPCKHCIARPMCTEDCYILDNYLTQLDLFDSDKIMISILCSIGGIIASLYGVGVCLLTPWILASFPFLWGGSLYYIRVYRDEVSIDPDTYLQYLYFILLLPSIAVVITAVLLFEKYYNKYSPTEM